MALFLGWIAFAPPGTYSIWSVPAQRSSPGKKFWLRWKYADGPVVNERIAVDFDQFPVCRKCIFISARGNIRGTEYRMIVLIAAERLILPVWVLAAIVAWKIGWVIAASQRGQMLRRTWMDNSARNISLYTRHILFMLLGVAACWLGYNLNWAKQRHIALQQAAIPLRSWNTVGAPWSLRWFGELGVAEIVVQEGSEQRLQGLFPESRLVRGSEWQAQNPG
jgi:hypothetical protein